MTDNEKLEALIKEYSDKLMEFAKREQPEQLQTDFTENVKNAQPSEQMKDNEGQNENIPLTKNEDASFNDSNNEAKNISPSKELIPEVEADPESFAYFTARVFTASNAFALKDAKVSIYKGDTLYAFLVTDENGETKRIKLMSYPETNSFEPENKEQRFDYSADVFADGFTTQRELLVSAVGGSEIVLNVAMIPESEGIN